MSWKFNKIERFYPRVCNRYELLIMYFSHECPFISKYYVCFLILQFCHFFLHVQKEKNLDYLYRMASYAFYAFLSDAFGAGAFWSGDF